MEFAFRSYLLAKVVCSLVYLTITRPDNVYPVDVVSLVLCFTELLFTTFWDTYKELLIRLSSCFPPTTLLCMDSLALIERAMPMIINQQHDCPFFFSLALHTSLGRARHKKLSLLHQLNCNIELWRTQLLKLFVPLCFILIVIVPGNLLSMMCSMNKLSMLK